jgi:FkbM family methyltransferase
MLPEFRGDPPRKTCLKQLLDTIARVTGLGNLPVRARRGLVSGALWTLYPFSSYWRGTSDQEAIGWLDRFCRPGGATLDLGAHFGLYTVAMALRVGPSGQVIALEPERAARAKCARHARLNRMDQVRIYPEAASATNGMIRLSEDGGVGSSTSFVSQDPGAGTWLPCTRLDDLYAREGLRPPEFIKVDVENHGAEALSGAPGILAGHPHILMSFHSEQELAGSRKILEPLGYRVISLAGKDAGWEEALYRTMILTTSTREQLAPRVPDAAIPECQAS